MNTLLRANSQTSSNLQHQPTGVATAAAAAAFLGIAIGAGYKLLCFIKSVFGGCDKRDARNQKYKTNNELPSVLEITAQHNEKFYVSGELYAIKEAQYVIIEIKNRNWELSESQFNALRQCTSHAQLCTISQCSRANHPTHLSPQ